MADPLLTTLCAICHAQPPRYTCPACHTHTCSLPCSQRHKAWAACTGRRDPTAFLPLHALKTPAGIDHDYNFLSAIERTRERNQRALLEGDSTRGKSRGGGLFTEAQLGRDLDSERRWRRQWFGDEVRFVSKDAGGGARGTANTMMGSDGEDNEDDGDEEECQQGGGGGGEKMSSLARRVRNRLDALGTEVVRMPVGMARQRDNTTAWNRRAGRINWCIEWIIYDDPAASSSSRSDSSNPPLRIRHKALETRLLYRALGDSLEWYHKGKQREKQLNNADDASSADENISINPIARKRRRILIKELKDDHRLHTSFAPPQDPITTAFDHQTPYPTQNPYTGAWAPADDRAAAVCSWLPDEATARWRSWRFYLLKAPTPAGKPRELIPLCDSGIGDETLGAALSGRTVVEYPTVYVLPPLESEEEEESEKLPPGFMLGSTERRAPTKKPKRKAEAQSGPKKNKNSKRQRGNGAAARGGGGGRGRGGRAAIARRPRRGGDEDGDDVEEGEVDSGGEDVAVSRPNHDGRGRFHDAVDTTSSDPDTSSDEDEEDEEDRDMMQVDSHRGWTDITLATATNNHSSGSNNNNHIPSNLKGKAGLSSSSSSQPARARGLVAYGSSSSDEDGDGEDEEEDGEITRADLASLKPENPELVAGAIQEIVGLLT